MRTLNKLTNQSSSAANAREFQNGVLKDYLRHLWFQKENISLIRHSNSLACFPGPICKRRFIIRMRMLPWVCL